MILKLVSQNLESLKCLVCHNSFNLYSSLNIQWVSFHEQETCQLLISPPGREPPSTLSGSVAITTYLSNDFCAETQQWMNLTFSEVKPFQFLSKKGTKLRQSYLQSTLNALDRHLASRAHLCHSREVCIADLHLAVDLLPLEVSKVWDLQSYPNLRQWLKKVSDLPGFQDGVQQFHLAGGKPSVNVSKPTPEKFKVLCLHGYRQSEKSFREKLGAFR